MSTDPTTQRETYVYAMNAATAAADEAYRDHRAACDRYTGPAAATPDEAHSGATAAGRRAAWNALSDAGIGGGQRDILAAIASLEATLNRQGAAL